MVGQITVSFPKKTLKQIDLRGTTILLRTDYNVPLKQDGSIADNYRLTQSLPTLQYLIKQKCRIIIISHLGRPDGKVDPKLSLEPVARELSKLLGQHVGFVPECIGDRVIQAGKHLQPGGVLLLENLRFHPGEEANDADFAKALVQSSRANYFIQDGFGVVHRAHASTQAITNCLPSVAGLLLEKEFIAIESVMKHPKKPLTAILGGVKVSDKIKVIQRLVEIADELIIGGAMATTFLAYKGLEVGKSVYEPNQQTVLKQIYQAAGRKVGLSRVNSFILLPTDVAVAGAIDKSQRRAVVAVTDVKNDDYILDIGPATIAEAQARIAKSATVIWNGTLGYAELPQFAEGSAAIAQSIAQNSAATSLIGGGDTTDFVLDWDQQAGKSFSHISTGGGASLELMAGDKLPGIEALMNP